jgi:hypothetical protein
MNRNNLLNPYYRAGLSENELKELTELKPEKLDFKNYVEKLEYVGENLRILFRYTHHQHEIDITEYKEIILINFLKDLVKCDDSSILI